MMSTQETEDDDEVKRLSNVSFLDMESHDGVTRFFYNKFLDKIVYRDDD